jgi:hypothetical protein
MPDIDDPFDSAPRDQGSAENAEKPLLQPAIEFRRLVQGKAPYEQLRRLVDQVEAEVTAGRMSRSLLCKATGSEWGLDRVATR